MKDRHFACLVMIWTWIVFALGEASSQVDAGVISETQPKLVKIYGAGGFANLHAYQSGVFYSNSGKIVTAWSHVLDGKVTVVDSLGRRATAKFIGMDPATEIAVLDIGVPQGSFFDLNKSTKAVSGMRILAFSNLFGIATKDEKQSVMSGVVSAVTKLDGKIAQFKTPYRGNAILVDLITNNPGAAGGAIVDHKGDLIGLIGKELKDRKTGVWLNFCLPASVVAESIKRIESGKTTNSADIKKVDFPFRLSNVGLELVPEVVETTPPFVDRTVNGSTAASLGFQPDDLILFINGQPVRTIKEVREALATIDRDEEISLIFRRDGKLLELQVSRNGESRRGPNE